MIAIACASVSVPSTVDARTAIAVCDAVGSAAIAAASAFVAAMMSVSSAGRRRRQVVGLRLDAVRRRLQRARLAHDRIDAPARRAR
jgi:hypothetical protein